MNQLEFLAYAKLKKNVSAFELEKEKALLELFQNAEYALLHKQEAECIIALSQDESNEELAKKLKNATKAKKDFIQKTNHNDVLKHEHLCNHCQDKGFVNGNKCICFKKLLSNLTLNQSGLNINLDEFEKSDFSIFADQEKAKKLYALAEKWVGKYETSDIRNWAFMGQTGTGKTFLMLHMAKKLFDRGVYFYFTTAHALTRDLLKEYIADENEYGDFLSKYTDCDVLFIDDLGTEINKKKVTNQLLYTVFNQRMLENKPIVFSSNFDLKELEDFYGERIFSRLINKRTTKSVWFDGNDFRLKK